MGDAVRITSSSGAVRVIGEERSAVTADGAAVADHDGAAEIRSRSKKVEVRVPLGTDLVVGTASGNVELEGELGDARITTASGDVQAEHVASIDARTKSGRVEVRRSAGAVRVKTSSSSIDVDRAEGEVRIASVSGNIHVQEAQGLASVRTVSGNVDVGIDGTGATLVETVSGTVRITVPAGVRPTTRLKTISGKRCVDADAGDDVEITARSVSGDLFVTAHP